MPPPFNVLNAVRAYEWWRDGGVIQSATDSIAVEARTRPETDPGHSRLPLHDQAIAWRDAVADGIARAATIQH
jgi:hypothetical protein